MTESASQTVGPLAVSESYAGGVGSVQASGCLSLPITAWGLSGKASLDLDLSLDAKVLLVYLAALTKNPVPEAVAAYLSTALAGT